jgi:heterodisulfide reductase subunit C2
MTDAMQWNGTGLLEEVQTRSGAAVSACLQCHKCSTGCPVGPEMDYLPSQVMRLLHLGAGEEVLRSRAIQICASCAACSTRCPMDIDIAGVMDTLRIIAIDRHLRVPDAHAQQFNSSFLASVWLFGRTFEMGMLGAYKLRSGDLFSDIDKVPQMFRKGKLALVPPHGGSGRDVRAIFRRAEKEEGKK